MEIRSLENTTMEEIVNCLTQSFEGYFVEMPSSVEFWETRFKNARVDKSNSWGVFDRGTLVAFVVNAVDFDNGILTAFNTGTGVVPHYRGNKLVDKMYNYGLKKLHEKGVQKLALEVIDKNQIAINVYKRIGFHLSKKLFCYTATLNGSNETSILEVNHRDIAQHQTDAHYSWDNRIKTIQLAGDSYKIFHVFTKSGTEPIGYFIMNPLNGYIAQLETMDKNWGALFDGIGQVQKNVRINNIPEQRTDLLEYLRQSPFENTINQFEMEMKWSG